MAKQVRDTSAGQSIGAYVILDKKGRHVATVNAHYAATVTVDVWNIGDDAAKACYRVAMACGKLSQAAADKVKRERMEKTDWLDEARAADWVAHDIFGCQQGRAGGYGYDKFAAAIAGLMIDGHTIANHCGQVPECEAAKARLFKAYRKATGKPGFDQKAWDAKAAKLGAHFANWRSKENGYASLYFVSGLDRLAAFGYRVISAI